LPYWRPPGWGINKFFRIPPPSAVEQQRFRPGALLPGGGPGRDHWEEGALEDVGIVLNLGVRHLTLSSEEGVRKPAFREACEGAGGEVK